MRGHLSERRKLLAAIAAGVLFACAGALVFIYFALFPTSSPKPFALASSPNATPVSPGTSLAGRWSIAAGSVAGYRVREKLGFLPAESDAVGRTSVISGQASVTESGTGLRITAASFTVAVNTLSNNEAMRGQHLGTIGLQSDRYPTARFVLADPLSLPASALDGRPLEVPATGIFDIHGTSRKATLPLRMSLSNTSIQAVGSFTFPWRAFNMTAPSVAGFVNVSAQATMEFDLRLQRA